jgi:hypothetical protein
MSSRIASHRLTASSWGTSSVDVRSRIREQTEPISFDSTLSVFTAMATSPILC